MRSLTLGAPGDRRQLLAVNIGAKADVKDWGDANWSELLEKLGVTLSGGGLVVIGAEVERERSAALSQRWPGASLNLCGNHAVRKSAAVLNCVRVYCGHHSDPMHRAAAVSTPCVAVFKSRNPWGEWFPYGTQHQMIYDAIVCHGSRLDVCVICKEQCINWIAVDEVRSATLKAIGSRAPQVTQIKPADPVA